MSGLPLFGGGGGSIEIAGIPLRNVRPAKRPGAGIATNKAGRIVLVGDAPSGRVKIFEAISAQHADFIREVSAVALDGGRFPAVLARSEQFIICEWLPGRPLSQTRLDVRALRALVRLQTSLHGFDPTDLPVPSFDYWEDIIVPRFLRASGLVGKREAAMAMVTKVRDWRKAVRDTLNHPDMSPANVVAVAEGDYVIVDNELLYAGGGWFMDVLNTIRSLSDADRSIYVDAYWQEARSASLPERDVMRAFWLAREAGAAFVAARVNRVSKLFNDPGAIEEDGVLGLLGNWT